MKNSKTSSTFKIDKSTQTLFITIFTTLSSGVISIYLFVLRSGWQHLKISQPLMYFADPVYYANLVANAQQGNPLHGYHLGGLAGQQYSMSAYGFEWVQSSFVSLFASAQAGPWLATNRFLIYTFFATAVCSFLALKYLKIPTLYCFFAAIAFSLIPDHQPYSVGLANMSVLPPALVVMWKLYGGASVTELFPWLTRRLQSERKKFTVSVLILLLLALFELTAATYYILLLILFGLSLVAVLLFKPGNARIIHNFLIFILTQVVALIICLGPILFNKLTSGLSFSEPSTGDRRPFAAYANGGDLTSLVSPFSERSFFYRILSHFKVFKNFYSEYTTSSMTTGTEYIIHPFGLLFLAFALLVVILIIKHNYKPNLLPQNYKSKLPVQRKLFSESQKIGLVFIGLALAWYFRGGLGTLTAFLFPYVRGYARFNAIVTFLALATLGTFIEKLNHKKTILIMAIVFCVLVDTTSSIAKIFVNNQIALTKEIGKDEIPGSASAIKNLKFTSLGYDETTKLLKFTNNTLRKGCLVYELPMMHFPVDFSIGIPSYYSYELIKPGISGTSQIWSAGGIPCTPANGSFDALWPAYANSNLIALDSALKLEKACGVLIFRSIADDISVAGNSLGNHFPSSLSLIDNLTLQYGKPCYVDDNSRITLFCSSGAVRK